MQERKIRVLHILNRFNLGGPTYYAVYLTRFLPEEFEAVLIGGVKDEQEGTSEYVTEQYGVKPVLIKSMHRSIGHQDFQAYKEIRSIIKHYKPDIVHTHAAKAGFLGRVAAKRCGVKVIVHTFHGHVFDKYFNAHKSNFYQILERFLAKISTAIIALSDKQRYDLVEKYRICSNDKIQVIPLGLDLAKYVENKEQKRIAFRKAYGFADDEVVIGIVGRLAPIKNHTLFIKAMQKVKSATTQKIKLLIVGDGEEHEHIENLCRQLNFTIANYNSQQGGECPQVEVIFTSWIKEVDEVYAGIDIVALTSLNEGTPGSLIEAQAANKPIVATRVGGVADIVKEGSTALLVESENVEEFAQKTLSLVEDKGLRHELSQNGSQYALDSYGYQQLVKNMAQLYHRLLISSGSSR